MSLHTVHLPPAAPTDDPAALVFVKEGFCWPALFIPELWLIFRRLWLVLALYLVLAVAILSADRVVDGSLVAVVFVLFRFLFATEANGLRRWTMERHGSALLGVVEGRTLEEAELRWFENHWPGETPRPSAPPERPSPQAGPRALVFRPSPEDSGVVGLFPSPGAGR